MKLINKLHQLCLGGDNRGDTLVEVLVSIAILSLALAAAYALGSSSLRTSLEANQRTEALALAQSQVELLANFKNTDNNFVTDYQINTPFCVTLAGTKTAGGTDNLCDGFNNTPYNIGVSYSSSTGVFTITAAWSSPDAPAGQAKLNLYYKLPGIYRKALVNTGAATNITHNAATLNGTVSPNGLALSNCHFNYGTDTSYGTQANCSSLPGGTTGTDSVSANISSLTPGTVYHFELCASNNVLGANCDSDVSFTTANKPTPTTQAASGVGTTSATLNGSVNPNGAALNNCYFDLGTTTGYGTQVNCNSLPGGSSGNFTVSGSASGLSQGTTYHFRLCAANIAGTNCDSDLTFTTTAAAPTLSFSASPTTVSYKGSSTLSWNSTNTTSCTASGAWSGTKATSGSASTGALTSSQTYYLRCSGPGGNTSTYSQTISVGPSGIYGYYYQGANFNTGPISSYIDPNIDFCSDVNGCENGWLNLLDQRTDLSNASCVSVYWTGQVLADNSGNYPFRTYSDDGIQVAVDGSYIINNWTQHSWTENDGSISLSAGWHTLQVWYQNNNGNGCYDNQYSADAILEWSPPGSGYQYVPQDHLRPY